MVTPKQRTKDLMLRNAELMSHIIALLKSIRDNELEMQRLNPIYKIYKRRPKNPINQIEQKCLKRNKDSSCQNYLILILKGQS